MKQRAILVFATLGVMLCMTGCKRIEETIEVNKRTTSCSSAVSTITIDKEWTFKDYMVDETDNELTVTIRFKPYKGEDNK